MAEWGVASTADGPDVAGRPSLFSLVAKSCQPLVHHQEVHPLSQCRRVSTCRMEVLWYMRRDTILSLLCMCRACLIWSGNFQGLFGSWQTRLHAANEHTSDCRQSDHMVSVTLDWASCECMAKATRGMSSSICSRRLPLQQLANGNAQFSRRRRFLPSKHKYRQAESCS